MAIEIRLVGVIDFENDCLATDPQARGWFIDERGADAWERDWNMEFHSYESALASYLARLHSEGCA